ncbi:type II toxin-antitoxin system VapC family toxin [Candidatus Poribacteria bacterium]|nr:type II toxin-antitoxin system VapC family toxin [Candidatus Poribacteria bacterium]
MNKRIYIETTIPSFYHTLRTDDESRVRQKWTRQWWNEYADEFILTSSVAVIEELSEGTSEKTQQRLDLLKDVELLPIRDEVELIARIYIERLIMPTDPSGDALHLAVASFYNVDALLTWNCKHLANANKINLIRQINQELSLPRTELTNARIDDAPELFGR